MPRKRKTAARATPRRRAPARKPAKRGGGRIGDAFEKYKRPLGIAAGASLLLAAGALPLLYENSLRSNGQFMVYDNRGWPSVASTF